MGVSPSKVIGPTAAGIDIRYGSWDVLIADVVTSPSSNMHVVRLLFAGKVRDNDDALFLLRQYKTRFGVADARPEATLAKRLQTEAARFGVKLWRAEYNTAPSQVEAQENSVEGTLRLDRTMSLDNVHWAFTTGATVALPTNYARVTDGDFVKEMTSSTRTPTKWQGKDCYVWDSPGADHAFHAFGYLIQAIKKSNMLAFGGNATMFSSPGLVARTMDKVITSINTGARPGERPKPQLAWDRLEKLDGPGRVCIEV
jgi:hypothetical protein